MSVYITLKHQQFQSKKHKTKTKTFRIQSKTPEWTSLEKAHAQYSSFKEKEKNKRKDWSGCFSSVFFLRRLWLETLAFWRFCVENSCVSITSNTHSYIDELFLMVYLLLRGKLLLFISLYLWFYERKTEARGLCCVLLLRESAESLKSVRVFLGISGTNKCAFCLFYTRF